MDEFKLILTRGSEVIVDNCCVGSALKGCNSLFVLQMSNGANRNSIVHYIDHEHINMILTFYLCFSP